jgi:hypothetical protein
MEILHQNISTKDFTHPQPRTPRPNDILSNQTTTKRLLVECLPFLPIPSPMHAVWAVKCLSVRGIGTDVAPLSSPPARTSTGTSACTYAMTEKPYKMTPPFPKTFKILTTISTAPCPVSTTGITPDKSFLMTAL